MLYIRYEWSNILVNFTVVLKQRNRRPDKLFINSTDTGKLKKINRAI